MSLFIHVWIPSVKTLDGSVNDLGLAQPVYKIRRNLKIKDAANSNSTLNKIMYKSQFHVIACYILLIIALWWWFCPCRVGGAVWNHTAWLFPLMPLPTESLFYSYFLSGNKYRKNITCKNIGQFQFCINLLPLALIWRSAPCLKHWSQRWFGDAAFTIPSGKQWDHMSPWSPSWLSAGFDECCKRKWSPMTKKHLARNDLTLDQ